MTTIKKVPNGFPTVYSELFDEDPFFKNEWFSHPAKKFAHFPAANIKVLDKEYSIELAVPGMKKEDFQISFENDMLNIFTEIEDNKEEKEQNYSRKEYNYNSFSRSFALPEKVKVEEIEAFYKDGILTVKVPKLAEVLKGEKKKITVG